MTVVDIRDSTPRETVRLSPTRTERFEGEARAARLETTDYIGHGYWGPVVFCEEDQLTEVCKALSGSLRLEREYGRWVIHPMVQ